MKRESIDDGVALQRGQEAQYLAWRRYANRIAQCDLVDAKLEQAQRERARTLDRRGSVIRADERRRKVAANADVGRAGEAADLSDLIQRLVDRRAQVYAIETLACSDDHGDASNARGSRALEATDVRH